MSDKLERAAKLWSQDKTTTEIAAELDMSRSAVAGMISRNRALFPARREAPDLRRKRLDRMAALWFDDVPRAEIAERCRLTPGQAEHLISSNRELFPPRKAAPSPKPSTLPEGRNSVAARQAAERQRRIDLVLPLWPTGMPIVDIADRTGLTPDAVHTIAKTRRDLFPPRENVARRARPVVPVRHPEPAEGSDKRSVRLAEAFRPLPGIEPTPLWRSCGCKWPVHDDGTDPLTEPTLLVCDAVQMVKKRTTGGQPILAPYCATHAAMAGGEAEWRASRERRAA